MTNFINKYKKTLSIVTGTVCLIAGIYAPLLSSFLLSEKNYEFTVTNLWFIALSIIFLWGQIVLIAKTLTTIFSNKFK